MFCNMEEVYIIGKILKLILCIKLCFPHTNNSPNYFSDALKLDHVNIYDSLYVKIEYMNIYDRFVHIMCFGDVSCTL